MKKLKFKNNDERKALLLLVALLLVCVCGTAFAQPLKKSPNLILTKAGVEEIKAAMGSLPLLDREVKDLEKSVKANLEKPIVVPVPKDAGGGYTHEVHKENYRSMYDAGVLYQLTGDTRYADYVKNTLLKYADLYPGLGLHPAKKEQAPGKLFWQSLNDCVWLLYSIQAYDAIKPHLKDKEIKQIEQRLFMPAARFLSAESKETFNKVHNHGTWAVAAVGMTGYVLNNKDLVEKALYGLQKDGKGGFMIQLDELFSPDGYYTEGPYYQRYALMPFVVFAQAIDNNEPQRKIFEHRNGIILKAINTAIQLTYNGRFLPFNDALKEKDLRSVELVYATNIAYAKTGDKKLLDIARFQNDILLTKEGLAVAKALQANQAEPYAFRSLELGDGASGKEGAVGLLRSGYEQGHQALVMKYTSQGMGHGHYDKLHWMFYDNGQEIVQDYGAARFLNIETKYGGHYLPENNTWAKQTIAHNTVVADEQSHFKGDFKVAMRKYPVSRFFDAANPEVQVMSAAIEEVYPGVNFTRTMAMINDAAFAYPVILDVFEVQGSQTHQYDLPLYYQGHIMGTNLDIKANTTTMQALGSKNGYEHLWHTATGKAKEGMAQVTWLNDDRFYTYTTLASPETEILFTRIGANDPQFNLRNEPGLLIRQKGAKSHTFVSVLEPHGEFNARDEYTRQAGSNIKSVRLQEQGNDRVVLIETKDGSLKAFALGGDAGKNTAHQVQAASQQLKWEGPYRYFKLK